MNLLLKFNLVLIPACLALTLLDARADVVMDWNVTALAATDAATPQIENRILAMTHVAMFDAANVITRMHTPFASQPSVAPGSLGWEPLLNTPPHPDYVSGHCVVSGATAEVLRLVLKSDGVPFTATYGSPATGLTRSFATITQAEKEIGDARVWAGIHTRTADEHGAIVGHKIAELVVQRAMKPLTPLLASAQ